VLGNPHHTPSLTGRWSPCLPFARFSTVCRLTARDLHERRPSLRGRRVAVDESNGWNDVNRSKAQHALEAVSIYILINSSYLGSFICQSKILYPPSSLDEQTLRPRFENLDGADRFRDSCFVRYVSRFCPISGRSSWAGTPGRCPIRRLILVKRVYREYVPHKPDMAAHPTLTRFRRSLRVQVISGDLL
jgi:hypothetical protein